MIPDFKDIKMNYALWHAYIDQIGESLIKHPVGLTRLADLLMASRLKPAELDELWSQLSAEQRHLLATAALYSAIWASLKHLERGLPELLDESAGA